MAKTKLNLKPAEEAPKVHRELDTIRDEYAQCAAKAGHLQYELFIKTKELNNLNETLRNLNFEAAASNAAAAQTPKPEQVTQ